MLNWLRSRSELLTELAAAKLQIQNLKEQLDDSGETYAYINQARGEAEAKARTMEIMRDPEAIKAASLRIAQEIEDLFVRGDPSGRKGLMAQLQVIIIGALQEALKGERDYDLGWNKRWRE